MSKNRRQSIALGAVGHDEQALCQLCLGRSGAGWVAYTHEKKDRRVSAFLQLHGEI
jgi:hypothetical protein